MVSSDRKRPFLHVPQVLRGAHSYRVLGKLGEGGQGAVFEAEDVDSGKRLAVKLLSAMSESAIGRFKFEFRTRERVAHPGLVEVGELSVDDGQWFFTMELVSGQPLLQYVAGSEERLRASFAQLADAIAALHGASVLHRDVKPDNVLVSDGGRVVLLDLGLAAELAPSDPAKAVGTPAYMAPELWSSLPADGAIDWYAYGVMLFEALTGQRPYVGSAEELRAAKQERPAPEVARVAPDAPTDLASLCDALLSRDPRLRAGAAEVARCFGERASDRLSATELRLDLVGRDTELRVLEHELGAARSGSARMVALRGESGIGKTALLKAFAEHARAQDVWVFAGRCYESESVPFKAVDQVVDGIALAAASLVKSEPLSLAPQHAQLLARLFPALSVLGGGPHHQAPLPADPAELRARALAALHALLERLSAQRPVLVCIDDAQWADADSIELLEQLVRRALPLLIVVSLRDGTVDSEELRRLAGERVIEVRPLAVAATRALATSISARLAAQPPELFARVHEETGGSPFLISEWARFVDAHGAEPGVQLQLLLKSRIAALTPSRRRLLTVVAAMGAPVEGQLAARVADSDVVVDAMGLRRERLLHTLERSGVAALDVYHDRIRQAVCADLEPRQHRAIHEAVSGELARLGAPPARRVRSQLAAGDLPGAARSAIAAAAHAEGTLAFLRAAEHYELAIQLLAGDEPAVVDLLVRRATAYQNALRPSQAAELLREASERCGDARRARALRRLSGEQFLLSGDLEQGMPVIQQALAEHALAMPSSTADALSQTMQLFATLSARGLEPERPGSLDPQAESRVELCLSIARCFHHVDLRGIPFALHGLLGALTLASPALLQEALAVFVMVTVSHLPNPLVEPAFARCAELARALGSAPAQALLALAEVEIEHFRGRYHEAARACEEAERTLIDGCVGVTRELGQVRSTMIVMAHSDRGDFRAYAGRAQAWIEDADRRRDRFYGNWLRAANALVWMAEDVPQRARDELARAEAAWPAAKGGTFETACALYLDAIDRYEDRPLAHEHAGQGRASVLESPVANTPLLQGYLHLHRAWGVLRELGARSSRHDELARAGLRKKAERAVKSLRRLGLPVWSAAADAFEANLCVLDGELARAAELLRQAHARFEQGQQLALAACVERRLGEVLGGLVGSAHWQSADRLLHGLGVVAPARFARAYFSPFNAREFEASSEATVVD
jgi:eukaryotic-like serine/threonine-protein kinase